MGLRTPSSDMAACDICRCDEASFELSVGGLCRIETFEGCPIGRVNRGSLTF